MYSYIGILLGARPILHISRIRVKEFSITWDRSPDPPSRGSSFYYVNADIFVAVKPGKFAPLLMVMFHICEVSVSNPDA
jgi:hypothetical protein